MERGEEKGRAGGGGEGEIYGDLDWLCETNGGYLLLIPDNPGPKYRCQQWLGPRPACTGTHIAIARVSEGAVQINIPRRSTPASKASQLHPIQPRVGIVQPFKLFCWRRMA